MRYTFLGDRLTDPALVGQPCDPVRREDGKCIIARVVPRRRLRVRANFCTVERPDP